MGMNVEAGGKGKRKGKVRPEMNVTPLVDVVLVLLIIFMVVTPLLTKKFWLHVPKKEAKTETPPPPSDDSKSVVVSLDDKQVIRINSDVVTEAELPDRLARIFAARNDRVIFFDAADGVEFGSAVRVMDVARGGGAQTIAVLTEKLAQ